MFQIAGNRVNRSLMNRRKKPVFDLQFTSVFNNPSSTTMQDEQNITQLIDRRQMLHAPSSMMEITPIENNQ